MNQDTFPNNDCHFLQIIAPERLPWGVEQCLPKDVNQWSCLALLLLLHQHTSKALTLLPFSLRCLWLNRYHLLSCILRALHILWNFSSYPVSREGRKLWVLWTKIDMNLQQCIIAGITMGTLHEVPPSYLRTAQYCIFQLSSFSLFTTQDSSR